MERTRDLVDGLEALLERVLLGQSSTDTALTRGSWLELRAAWQHTLQLATTSMAPREVCTCRHHLSAAHELHGLSYDYEML